MVRKKGKLRGWKQYVMSLKSHFFYRKIMTRLKSENGTGVQLKSECVPDSSIWDSRQLLKAATEKEVRSESKRCRCQCCLGLRGRTSQQSDGQQNPLIKQSAEHQRTEARDRAEPGRAQRQMQSKTNNTGTLSPFVRVKNKTPPVSVALPRSNTSNNENQVSHD